jgi:FlaA1/EpsC-like NDP-sugar epimerase
MDKRMFKSFLKRIIKKNTPRWIVLIIDCYIVSNTFIIAYLIRFNFNFSFDKTQLKYQIPLVVIFALIGFISTGSYKGIIRHTGVRDAINVTIASVIIFVLLIFFVLVNRNIEIISNFTIPKTILVIHLMLNVIMLISSRYLYKELYNLIVSDLRIDRRVLIYGAGEAALLTYLVLRDDKESNVHVVGFVDDDIKKAGKKINGLPVFHSDKLNNDFIKSKHIDEIIFSIQKIRTAKLLEIIDKLTVLPAKVKMVPSAKKWIQGDLNAKQIKSVKIEDLLGREPISLNNPLLHKEFNKKTILITGAAGSIGSEIVRQLVSYNCKQLVLIDQAESELYNLQQFLVNKNIDCITAIVADVKDKKRMDAIFKQFKPNAIFHAAAYKHVPFMEEYPYEAVAVNVYGTKNIADLAVKYEVEKFVMISTDKAVNPTNVMGATKRIAEMYINCLNNNGKTKFITTRFGNVLGSNGSVIPLFKAQIKAGGPLTLTHKEITRFFMTIPEACQLVLEAGAMGNGGEIFVFDMGESIKIYDLARNMIHLSGLNYPKDIDIKVTGLRPGEKIYEELLADGENTSATYHEKIMIANVQSIDKKLVNSKIQELCELNKTQDFKTIVLKMKEIVPEFVSNNSEYEQLDEKDN